MSSMDKLIEQLKLDEGFVAHAYQDHLGYTTLGYGFMVDKARNGQIPKAIADVWLAYEVAKRIEQLLGAAPWIVQLSEPRQAVLYNMAYQLGVRGVLNFKRTLELVKAGEYSKASSEMLNSAWFRQTPARAMRLSAQMETGEWTKR